MSPKSILQHSNCCKQINGPITHERWFRHSYLVKLIRHITKTYQDLVICTKKSLNLVKLLKLFKKASILQVKPDGNDASLEHCCRFATTSYHLNGKVRMWRGLKCKHELQSFASVLDFDATHQKSTGETTLSDRPNLAAERDRPVRLDDVGCCDWD